MGKLFLAEVRTIHLFAGAGGGILGDLLLGHRPICAVERDGYCQRILNQRQRDQILPRFPIWDDVKTFEGKQWQGITEGICAGFPCQPFSTAGKRAGEEDGRNGWPETIRIIREVGPQFAFLENVPGLISFDYFGQILGDLEEAGFDAEWDVISAGGLGAPHRRDRLWMLCRNRNYQTNSPIQKLDEENSYPQGVQGWNIRTDVGDGGSRGSGNVPGSMGTDVPNAGRNYNYPQSTVTKSDGISQSRKTTKKIDRCSRHDGGSAAKILQRTKQSNQCANVTNTNKQRQQGSRERRIQPPGTVPGGCSASGWWDAEPGLGRVAHGVADRVERLRAIGNGQVPIVAAIAFLVLAGRLGMISECMSWKQWVNVLKHR